MGYPGDQWPSPYGGGQGDTPPGQYGGADPYRPGGSDAPGNHDPYRGYPPLNESPQSAEAGGHNTPQDPYGGAPQSSYGSGQQSPYAAPGPSGPYGPPASPYGDPSGYGYAPSGPQPPQSGASWPGSPPGGGYGMPAPGGPPGPPPGGGKKLALIIGGVVAAVVVFGGGGTAVAFALNSGDEPAPKPTRTGAQPTASSPPASPSPTTTSTKSGGRWMKISSRSTDPKPLTAGEVFGHSRLSADGHSYRRVTHKSTAGCGSAVTGPRLKRSLNSGNCTQLLRATFLRGDGKMMGTVGIGNLSDSSSARQAFSAAAGGKQYVTPLRGASGRTSHLGPGASALGIRQTRGHYLILSWVQYADGHKPASSAGRKKLAAFHKDVVSSTLTRPLSYRMLMGRPRP